MNTTKPHFPILEAEMAKHGISRKAIAEKLSISERALGYKLNGETDFWWNEVLLIHNVFPEVEPERLFSHEPDTMNAL